MLRVIFFSPAALLHTRSDIDIDHHHVEHSAQRAFCSACGRSIRTRPCNSRSRVAEGTLYQLHLSFTRTYLHIALRVLGFLCY